MKTFLIRFGICLFLVLVALVIYGQCLGLGLSHDEHQFIAPAVLWAREGLLPYRDVPLFHQPYLIYVYAILSENAASPLLALRLLSGTAAFLTSGLLFGCTWRATHLQTTGFRFVTAASVTLLWLTSDLFFVSSGRTWNHDIPSLLALSAFALLLFSKKIHAWHWLLAGLLAGLATGTRLTFAPFAAVLPFTTLLWREIPLRNRWTHLASASVGLTLALLPSAWFYLQDPDAYLFGNFEFPRLPLLEADNSRILKTTTPWRKIRFFFKEVVVSNLPLALATITLGILFLQKNKRIWQWLIPSLALLAGAFAPSRYEMQHFYIVAPLAALSAAYFLQFTRPVAIYVLLSAALISSLLGGQVFTFATQLWHRADWDVTRIHQQGLDLHAKVPTGKILTLGPIVALEGGLSIYPQLATGRFGWKFAYLVPKPRRQTLGLLAKEDLSTIEPPAAIITGYETEKLEKPLLQYATKHGYLPEPFDDDTILWRKP